MSVPPAIAGGSDQCKIKNAKFSGGHLQFCIFNFAFLINRPPATAGGTDFTDA
jgi:hypothetical protein